MECYLTQLVSIFGNIVVRRDTQGRCPWWTAKRCYRRRQAGPWTGFRVWGCLVTGSKVCFSFSSAQHPNCTGSFENLQISSSQSYVMVATRAFYWRKHLNNGTVEHSKNVLESRLIERIELLTLAVTSTWETRVLSDSFIKAVGNVTDGLCFRCSSTHSNFASNPIVKSTARVHHIKHCF